MNMRIRRACAAMAAGATLSVIGAAGAGVPGTSARAAQVAGSSLSGMPVVGAVPGAQLWASRYRGRGDSVAGAAAVAVSPDGGTVFVTGQTAGGTPIPTYYGSVAYSAVTGAQLWARRYHRAGIRSGVACCVAVSPDGRTVFVTGDIGTVAFRAATGAQFVGDSQLQRHRRQIRRGQPGRAHGVRDRPQQQVGEIGP